MAKRPPSSKDDLRARIRQAGLRSTVPRVTVLQRLSGATAPLTHAELAAELAEVGFDKATIYRNLVELAEAGIVSRIELGDHVWRFEFKPEGEEHAVEHPHFVCIDCGEVSCLPGVSINVSPDPTTERSVIGHVTQVLLKGHCDRCL